MQQIRTRFRWSCEGDVSSFLNLRYRAGLIVGTSVIGVLLAGGILLLSDRADESRRVQIQARRVEAHAQQISGIEWEALARGYIDGRSLEEFSDARREMDEGVTYIQLQHRHAKTTRDFKRSCEQYAAAVDRELSLVRAGRFVEAARVDEFETDPAFSRLKLLLDQLNAEYSRDAEKIILASKAGLVGVALIAMCLVLLYFHFHQLERHKSAVVAAEERALRQSEERFRTLTNNSADVVLVMNLAGVVTFASPSMHRLLGLREDEVLGVSHRDRIHPDDIAQLETAFRAVVESSTQPVVEFRVRHADGSWIYFECVMRNLLGDPNVKGLLLNARDITIRKKALNQLAFDARHDSLTRLPNRTHFVARLEAVIERTRRRPELVSALLFIDLDDFKVVNDCLGHDAGDLLLRQVAERLTSSLRREDMLTWAGEDAPPASSLVARLGGDEFTILLEDLRDPSDAVRVAQRIQVSLSEPFVLCGQEVFKGASIGVAIATPESTAEALMANADAAMYRAKNNGKSRCEIFDGVMHAQATKRLELETALRRAFDRGEFRLHYQPVVSLHSGETAGFEALLRWQRPDAGLIFPGEFIDIAEAIGLIVPLGKWVLHEACAQAAAWNCGREGAGLHVCINVSGRQFSYPGFVDQVRETLAVTRVDPALVILEITETTAMADADDVEEVMLQLRSLGVKLSIDDFGTGYSSLSSLRRFPLSTLKIDRSFVSTLHLNSQSHAIVNTIISLARNLGMEVVAEGIENIEQLEKLQQACDFGQGYLFSHAIAAEAIPGYLHSNTEGQVGAAADSVSATTESPRNLPLNS